jgi:hypothetical protein
MENIGLNPSRKQWNLLIKGIFLSIILCSSLISQVRIREKVEIKPSNTGKYKQAGNTTTPNVTLSSLNMSDFTLYGSGFIYSYDEIYDDRIFVPRIGGIMGISLNQFSGSATND